MKYFLPLLFLLTACGQGSSKQTVDMFTYAESFCANHFGYVTSELQGSDLSVKCRDGSNALFKNWWLTQ